MNGFIVYPTYRIIEKKAFVYLFGRLENGESFLTINEFKPYFYIDEKAIETAKKIEFEGAYEIERTRLKNFNNQPVAKVTLEVPKEVPILRDKLKEQNIETYEADIRFVYRFLIDHGLKGAVSIKGEYKKGNFVNRIYENPKLAPAEFKPQLKVLSFDIETSPEADEIYSIALYCENYKKVLIVSDTKLNNAVSFSDEKSMLEFFKEKIIELDPDIITGWNVIDFDLSVIKNRLDNYNIKFNIGRAEWPTRIRVYESFWKDSDADVPGRMVLDGMHLIRISFLRLEDYKLETAARALLGESKLQVFNYKDKAAEIRRLFDKEPQKLADYNLKDAELVYKILEKKGLIDLSIQRSLLTGMQLDRVKASIASLDNLYLRETKTLGYVCKSSDYKERGARIIGGYVRDSIPGIYDNIIVLDFKSLYPSIMRTFNIDPLSYVPEDKEKNYKNSELIESPNGAKFLKKDGIMPQIIQRLWEQRDKAKRKGNKEESYAIKITMNSFFGVMANPMCRFYNLNTANAITHFGQYIVKETAELVHKEGYIVIYGDTDSIFVKTDANKLEEAEKIGRHIQEEINIYWNNYVKKKYNKKSFLELQFEKTYLRFLMPRIRGSEKGAKKRYVGLLIQDGKEKIDFTGLEFVRRDWTELSKKFQMDLLDRIFHKKEISDYIKQFVDDVKQGKYNSLLIYKKAIRKDLRRYVKTTPPHVKAARKLDKLTSNIIEYVITEDGPEPVQDIRHPIDYEHYIEKQIKPIADSVLIFYKQKFDDIVKGSSQKTLFSY
ncbi:DNA polymerase II [Candidatus Woesearchaeota archaeon]|nr:DNA polymerase II [Candidatus Woesearchaeota archaeon]